MLNCNHLFSNIIGYKIYDLVSLVMIVSVIALSFYSIKKSLIRDVGMLLLSFGGIGNIIDRELIHFGCVYDPFNFFGLFNFNVYDILITLGVIVVIFSIYTYEQVESVNKN